MPNGFSGPRTPTATTATKSASLARGGTRQTQRDTQRLLKVDPEHKTFKHYYGLTFVSMLPRGIQDDLYNKVVLLERELRIRGLLDYFLFVPSVTYHFTLEGVVVRSVPDIEQDEVDYYFSVATTGLTVPTGTTFDVEANEFNKFSNLALWVRATASTVPAFVNTLKSNLGKKSSKGDFHITVAYYRDRLTKDYQTRRVEEALRQATSQAFTAPYGSPLRWSVDNAKMYYFSSMEYYEEIPSTELI